MSNPEVAKLQPGQWVKAGPFATATEYGRFWGIKQSGSVVVAWQGNARNRANYQAYQRTLHNYAKSVD